MCVIARPYIFIIAGLLLVGCSSIETRSIVSGADIPASKYSRLALFVENLDETERLNAEQMILPVLKRAGVAAIIGPDIFKGRANKLSEKEKASLVQKEFDAVLYVSILDKGVVEELVPNAQHNGQTITFLNSQPLGLINFNSSLIIGVDQNTSKMYVLKQDGSVYQLMLALKTRADLQDTQTNKQVWTAETVASGKQTLTNMSQLFTQASQQIVEKMRADGAI